MFNQKILCVGNNSITTDEFVSQLAQTNNTVNHGLVIDVDCIVVPGYYHTSLADLNSGQVIALAKKFDRVVMLDQPAEQWSHWKVLLSTYKLMKDLEKTGASVDFRNNRNVANFQEFETLIDNKSFCIYPWINYVEDNGSLRTCVRTSNKVTNVIELKNWKTDPKFDTIRDSMLAGNKLPNNCGFCYKYEQKNIESYREFETLEWIAKLNLQSAEQLKDIEHPYYYEIRINNKCNLMCRSCKPEHSSSIQKEYTKHGIIFPYAQQFAYGNLSAIDINTLSEKVRVYLTGGDPATQVEVYDWMEACISQGRTDFDFTLGTSAAKLNKRFLKLTEKFTNMNFSISIDGYDKVNDYWRWGSDWHTVIANTKILEAQGHTISINCVPGIYNVTNLHLLLEFLDQEFPRCGLYLQLNHLPMQSAFNHPDADAVMKSMDACKKTNAYHRDGKSVKTLINSVYDYYANNPTVDLNLLKQFFEYNDKLDSVRNVQLKDYIPELDACRKYIS